jgi:hypothetical protein
MRVYAIIFLKSNCKELVRLPQLVFFGLDIAGIGWHAGRSVILFYFMYCHAPEVITIRPTAYRVHKPMNNKARGVYLATLGEDFFLSIISNWYVGKFIRFLFQS